MRTILTSTVLYAAALRSVALGRAMQHLLREFGPLLNAALAASIGASLGLQPADAQARQPDMEVLALPPTPAPIEPALKPAPVHAGAASAPAAARPKAVGTPAARPRVKASTAPVQQESASTERLVWDKAPLQLALGVGPERERAITFAAQMHIGVPQEIAHLLRIQTVGRTSYVTALAPFPRTRVIAEDRATGAVILLDLVASAQTTSSQPVSIVSAPAGDARSSEANSADEGEQPPVDMVTLTRFAAQQMYAPRRLTRAHPAIRRVPLDTTPIAGLHAGAGLRATPAAQWRGDGFYVTAVMLNNLLATPLELNPLDIRGRWRAVTFQHGRLLARGTEADTTVVYLVCERPFDTCR
ncbi:hypothetical protein RHDC3_01821 [Rhodocyclaceae bacterium]|nr:hypothetical protein RHDC3_01821 [Rhodocyclaceae bacterium]